MLSASLKKSVLILTLFSIAACSSKKNEDKYIAQDVEIIYHLAQDNLDKKRYKLAAAAFDEVERQHPYSVWARRAQLMAAYANYMSNNYDDSILAAERFLQLHPGNRAAPYAYYLIALCYYEQISDVGRDQGTTEKAEKALLEVIRRYPDTDYGKDARLKIDLTRDHLAGKDMEVGRFYLNQHDYLSATIRFRRVIEQYQTTSHTPEALHRLVETNLALGIQDEAQMAAAVLGHNFAGSKWYRYSYALLRDEDLAPEAKPDSWLSKLWPF